MGSVWVQAAQMPEKRPSSLLRWRFFCTECSAQCTVRLCALIGRSYCVFHSLLMPAQSTEHRTVSVSCSITAKRAKIRERHDSRGFAAPERQPAGCTVAFVVGFRYKRSLQFVVRIPPLSNKHPSPPSLSKQTLSSPTDDQNDQHSKLHNANRRLLQDASLKTSHVSSLNERRRNARRRQEADSATATQRQHSRDSAFYSTSASVSSSFVEGAGLERVSHRRREAVTRQQNREQQRLRRLFKLQEETVHSHIQQQEKAFGRLHERLHRHMAHQREEIRTIQAAAPFGSATDKYPFVRTLLLTS